MSYETIESFFNCPYCFEEISMLLEPHHEKQAYVEDCEVCCQPINIEYLYNFNELQYINVKSLSS